MHSSLLLLVLVVVVVVILGFCCCCCEMTLTEKLPFPISVRCLHILSGSKPLSLKMLKPRLNSPFAGSRGSDFGMGRGIGKTTSKAFVRLDRSAC